MPKDKKNPKMMMPEMKMKVTKISAKEMGLMPDTAKRGTEPRKTSVRGGKEERR